MTKAKTTHTTPHHSTLTHEVGQCRTPPGTPHSKMGRRRVRRHPDGATDPRLPALLALQALLARAVAAPEPAWDRVDGVERYQCRHRDVEPAYWGVTEGRRAGGATARSSSPRT